MQIGGFQKMTMLDFPGKIACTVFTYGCNFRCPFCHNATLVIDEASLFDKEEILSYLKEKKECFVEDGTNVDQTYTRNYIRHSLFEAFIASLVIAVVTFGICFAGVFIGKKAGTKLAGKAGILGGSILIFIGLEIFISSFF